MVDWAQSTNLLTNSTKQNWNCFKGSIRESPERHGGAHIVFCFCFFLSALIPPCIELLFSCFTTQTQKCLCKDVWVCLYSCKVKQLEQIKFQNRLLLIFSANWSRQTNTNDCDWLIHKSDYVLICTLEPLISEHPKNQQWNPSFQTTLKINIGTPHFRPP